MAERVGSRFSMDYDGGGVALGFENDIVGALGSLSLAWMIEWRVYMIGRKGFGSEERVFGNESGREGQGYGNGTEKPRKSVVLEWMMTET